MNISLKTHYRLEAIPIIRSFVSEAASYYGADSNEVFEIGMAAEEVAEHIITTYPPAEAEAPFSITCERKDGFLRFIFSNTGLPVNVDAIPEYDIHNPDTSIDGLQFFLIEKLTDDFRFVNLGKLGWQTVIDKKLKALKEFTLEIHEQSPMPSTAPSGKLSLSIATPEDAYEITKLAYLTYRYTYAKTIFYYPELLKEKLASQQIISFIIKNETGEIIAHSALLRSDNCHSIAEAGAMMTMPEYRRSTAIMRMVNEIHRYLQGPENPGIVFLESNLVTAHIASQRICRSFKFIPLALKISVHERAHFIDIEDIRGDRETLLYSIRPYSTPSKINIFPPSRHTGFIEKMMKTTGLNFSLEKRSAKNQEEKSHFHIMKIENSNYAKINVQNAGKDFINELKKLTYNLSLENIVTIALSIPMSQPLPEKIEEKLNAINFFFSGIIPVTLTEWNAKYTMLIGHKIDFDLIKVVGSQSVALKDYVHKEYTKVIP